MLLFLSFLLPPSLSLSSTCSRSYKYEFYCRCVYMKLYHHQCLYYYLLHQKFRVVVRHDWYLDIFTVPWMSYWAVNRFNIERVKRFSVSLLLLCRCCCCCLYLCLSRIESSDIEAGDRCSKSIKWCQEDAYSICITLSVLKSRRFLFHRK